MIDLFQQSTVLVEFKGNVRLIQNTNNSTIFGIHGILVSGQGLERKDSLKLWFLIKKLEYFVYYQIVKQNNEAKLILIQK